MLEVYGPVSARALQLYSNFQVLSKVTCSFDKQKVFLESLLQKQKESQQNSCHSTNNSGSQQDVGVFNKHCSWLQAEGQDHAST